ncbi:MAG: MFS transporter, partial [Caulobacterales bacterium]|nr:MFS transporter [Caulobacterales bacterium]
LAAAAVLGALIFIAFALTTSIPLWFLLRLLYGAAITVVFVGSELWINQLAPPEARARILGLYGAVLAGGFGLGAGVFALIGAEGALGFLIGAAFTALAALAALPPAPRIRPPQREAASPASLLRVARASPLPICAAMAFGAIELASLNFLPIYALRLGFGEHGAGVLMVALALGNIALQAPIGWLADRFGRARVLALCAAAGMLAPLGLFLAGPSLSAASLVVFAYGGGVVAMYAVGLAIVSAESPPGRLAQANAAFIFAYGAGSLFAPAIAGVAIDAIDPYGVLIALSGFAAAYLAAAAALRR